MFKHILVPLDGTHLAEAALAPAAQLAARLDAAITLVHIIEKSAPVEVHGDRHLTDVEGAGRYLAQIAQRPFLAALRVETHVHSAEVSDVARSIAEHEAELAPDLIVMAAHGKRDARQLIVGTIAQQVIALGRTPVLVIRPSDAGGQLFTPGGTGLVLVPIDRSAEHEGALPVAAELAAAFGLRLHLLMVVPKVGDLRGSESAAALVSPNAMRLRLQMDSEGADEYLKTIAAKSIAAGTAVTTEMTRGDVPGAIVETARQLIAELIVMGTHGKAGSEAFWSESVAASVATRTELPVLLVPVRH